MMRLLSRIKVSADMIEDLLGAMAIVTILIVGIWIAYGLNLPTGGAELLEAAR